MTEGGRRDGGEDGSGRKGMTLENMSNLVHTKILMPRDELKGSSDIQSGEF